MKGRKKSIKRKDREQKTNGELKKIRHKADGLPRTQQ